ncbi:helix-turn-helix transcriptional regulator [Sagittula salina]|uniref:Helix-turn-helix transcriptional regulator n=1 Tax=Sagittula salina TaxID=2820268 RepID=A0A940S216_9RHOB|nr:helix-turn-helix transcriptional regulator [Sagittula salina]MBP0484758.1 helix-turn-helix transcriptional regulator [Sagittula salina]
MTEHEFLTVPELADLLRLKERKIYDLAATGEVPCTRATGKLLFPAAGIRAWLDAHSEGAVSKAPRPGVVLGSHDPLLDWAIRESRCGLATYFDGSSDGLARFRRREGVAAGLHLLDPDGREWNVPRVARECSGQNAVLVRFAARERGLVLGRDVTGIAGMADLAGRRVVPRQPESGSDLLFGLLAAKAGLDMARVDLTEVTRTETEAVQAVARGDAEATLGLRSVARDFGFNFVPLIEERFDLVVNRRAWFDTGMQRLMVFCQSEAMAERAERMGGYDLTGLGTVRWNA